MTENLRWSKPWKLRDIHISYLSNNNVLCSHFRVGLTPEPLLLPLQPPASEAPCRTWAAPRPQACSPLGSSVLAGGPGQRRYLRAWNSGRGCSGGSEPGSGHVFPGTFNNIEHFYCLAPLLVPLAIRLQLPAGHILSLSLPTHLSLGDSLPTGLSVFRLQEGWTSKTQRRFLPYKQLARGCVWGPANRGSAFTYVCFPSSRSWLPAPLQ